MPFTVEANVTVDPNSRSATAKGLVEYITRDMRHKAGFPERSTSPTSNLVGQEELRAVTKLVGYLDGSEYF